jgi:hypothetical protein
MRIILAHYRTRLLMDPSLQGLTTYMQILMRQILRAVICTALGSHQATVTYLVGPEVFRLENLCKKVIYLRITKMNW